MWSVFHVKHNLEALLCIFLGGLQILLPIRPCLWVGNLNIHVVVHVSYNIHRSIPNTFFNYLVFQLLFFSRSCATPQRLCSINDGTLKEAMSLQLKCEDTMGILLLYNHCVSLISVFKYFELNMVNLTNICPEFLECL